MYGKHFAAMYCGSMVGAGFGAYSVMGYVIANMKRDSVVGFQVDLNATLLATTFGEPKEAIQKAIDYLCAPDPDTRTPGDDGRRIIKVGTFSYRVVNGVHYDEIRNEEHRREQNRQAQARFRAKNPSKQKRRNPNKGAFDAYEPIAVAAHDAGDDKAFDQAVTASLPPSHQ